MAGTAEPGRRGFPWRLLGWGTAAALLLLPMVAMQFTDEVNWSPFDFVFAGLLFGSVGLAFELTVRASDNWAFRGGVAVTLAAAFLTVWVNAAVGMIGAEDNPYNLLFLGVIVLALIGAIVARFRPAGMAAASLVAAVAQAGLGAGGLSTDLRGGILSTGFALLWLLAAALFRKAAVSA
ncbi:MAG: hypothetical protein QOI38_1361 [Sphingomonadales bacterium]|jgi:hypothetical protein|nr:hypothetical protein [Sphingomonadales bacterium]